MFFRNQILKFSQLLKIMTKLLTTATLNSPSQMILSALKKQRQLKVGGSNFLSLVRAERYLLTNSNDFITSFESKECVFQKIIVIRILINFQLAKRFTLVWIKDLGYKVTFILFISERKLRTSLLYPGKYCHFINFIFFPSSESLLIRKQRKQ